MFYSIRKQYIMDESDLNAQQVLNSLAAFNNERVASKLHL